MLLVFFFAGHSAYAQPGILASPSLVITPLLVSDGQYGAVYKSQTFKATGGKSPYTYTISAGSLPPGMSLSAAGVLSGTPGAAGIYSFTVTATDAAKAPKTLTGSQKYSLLIDQADLKITADNASMSAGSALPVFTATYSGFVNGDDASSLTTAPKITTTATSASPTGVYPITVSGAVDANYIISYVSGKLTVNAVNIVVTAQAATKEYGATDPALTYTVSGLPNGVTTSIFTGSLARAAGENVGSYAISKGTLSAGAGYSFTFNGSVLTVTKASQQISWMQSLLIGCNTTTQLLLNATTSGDLPVTFSSSDASVATVTGNMLTLVNPGTAVITASQAGDANHAAATAVHDTVVYQPASLITQHWSDVLFFDNSSGDFVQWQWYKNGDSVPGATQPYYSETPSLKGQYYVVATNKGGQEIQSCTLNVTSDTVVSGGITAFPNPARVGTSVTVNGNYAGSVLQGAVLQVVDLNGRVRQVVTAVQPSTSLTMPTQTGIYIINLILSSGQKVSTNVLVE